ncbi:MAG: MerC family mercury resistance protein [Myxococcaceae bacterium]
MPRVELLYFPGCPNLENARTQLSRAMVASGLRAAWSEVDVTSAAAPPEVRGYGSPTVLVDGVDVTGGSASAGATCRLYPGSEVPGVPPLAAITAALRGGGGSSRAASLAAVPGVVFSFLPVVGCPACWPAYAGVLGSLGVPFLMDEAWLLPLTIGAMALALGGLAFRARRRRGFGPFSLGTVAAVGVVAGKFALDVPEVVYTAAALLAVASAWNSWPRRKAAACESCAPLAAPQN